MPAPEADREALQAAVHEAAAGLVGREALVELVVLAAVAGEHLLVVGAPGTGKSAAVRQVARALGGRFFEYLLGRFSEPAELFGPVDLRRLREGELVVETTGMLPEADLAFLDELFLGSTAILNTLLSVLNEGRFRRGRTDLNVPLRLCVAACNELPQEPALAALSDRFLVRVFIQPLPDARLEELLAAVEPAGAHGRPDRRDAVDRLGALDALRAAARAVDLGDVRGVYAEAVRSLRTGGISLSDRRVVRAQRLVAAAAALAGRDAANEQDLWPLLFAVPTEGEQSRARDLLPALLAPSSHRLLAHAVNAASDGPGALASRLVAEAAVLPASLTASPDRARALGWLRDVDVAFHPDDLPAPLAAARAAILTRMNAEEAGAPPAPRPG